MSFLTNATNTIKGWFGIKAAADQKSQAEIAMRQRTGGAALSFYEGNAPKQLVIKPGQPDDNVFINYPQTIVDKGVAFLFGDELKISIGTDEDQSGEEYIERVWPAEQRAEDLIDAATDGGVFGDAYLKIRINEQGDLEVLTLDPNNMTVETDPNDYRRALRYICQYDYTDERGAAVKYREETALEGEQWIVRQFESRNGTRFVQMGDETVWNYRVAPIFHCKNLPNSKNYYGKPDLTKSVLTLCAYLSRLDSIIGKIVRVHSSPKPWARGLQKQDLQMGVDDVLFLGANPEAALGLLEMKGDLAGAIAFRKQLRECLAEISHIPEIAASKTENLGQLSGRALKILYGPLIDQTKKKQRLYGAMIKRVITALLEVGGFKDLEVKVQWADPIPSDPKEEAEIALLQKQFGVSEDTLQKQRGFDPKHEREMNKLNISANE